MMPADDLTGGNRVVATYAKILRARGHEVLVVSNAPDRPSVREQLRALRHGQWRAMRARLAPKPGHIALSGVPHKVLDRPRPVQARDLPDADVLIATWWETAVWMQAMPAAKGRKVHLIQGFETWTGGEVRERVHAALRLPNLKLAISAGLKRDIEAELGDLGIAVVPNAVDLQQFDAPPRARGEPPTVGFIYAQAPFKGADRCLRAVALARQTLPELRVLAFGADQPTPEWPLPADTRYVCRPAQDQLATLYASCDAWLFPSRVDSFGLPILEAMACRTPVIGVPVGAAPELLADGAGVLVGSSSAAMSEQDLVEEMARAILAVCQQPASAWQRMSQCAYERAHSYSWIDATDRLLTELQS